MTWKNRTIVPSLGHVTRAVATVHGGVSEGGWTENVQVSHAFPACEEHKS